MQFPHHISYHLIAALLLILIVLSGSACGREQSQSDDTQQPQTTQPAQVQPESPQPLPTSPFDQSTATQTLTTLRPGDGLETLDSYRMHITFSFQDEADTTKSGTTRMVMSVQNITRDVHAMLSIQGASSGTPTIQSPLLEVFEIGDLAYFLSQDTQTGEQSCTRFPRDEHHNPLNPDDMLGPVEQARLVGTNEIINGVATNRYTMDDAALFFSEMNAIEQATVTVWVAQDGGYMVKLDAVATGDQLVPSVSNEPIRGLFTMTYALEAINQIDTIAVPEACVFAE